MISFLAGKPNPATFPFESIEIKLKSGVQMPGEHQPHSNGAPALDSVTISGRDIEEALQYGATSGLPSLVKVRDPHRQNPRLLTGFLALFERYRLTRSASRTVARSFPNARPQAQQRCRRLAHQRRDRVARLPQQGQRGCRRADAVTYMVADSARCIRRALQAFQTLVNPGDSVLMESPAYSYAEGWVRITVPDEEQLADDESVSFTSVLRSMGPAHRRDMVQFDSQRHAWSHPSDTARACRLVTAADPETADTVI